MRHGPGLVLLAGILAFPASARWFEFAHLSLWQTLIMLDALLVWLLWMRGAPARAPLAAAAA